MNQPPSQLDWLHTPRPGILTGCHLQAGAENACPVAGIVYPIRPMHRRVPGRAGPGGTTRPAAPAITASPRAFSMGPRQRPLHSPAPGARSPSPVEFSFTRHPANPLRVASARSGLFEGWAVRGMGVRRDTWGYVGVFVDFRGCGYNRRPIPEWPEAAPGSASTEMHRDRTGNRK